MVTRTKVAIGVGVGLLLLWWLTPTTAADPRGTITLSNYGIENGKCYRVDFYADGSHTATAVDASLCDSNASTGDLTF